MPLAQAQVRHKVFISYYHAEDEEYREKFERLFSGIFINKSVQPGEIDSDNSAEYIKRLIQEGHISDTSVLVVLVGAHTWSRKHVDWEISAALMKKVGGYSGLLGLWLPTHPDYGKDTYRPDAVPPRLVDNVKSGYANLYDWTADASKVKRWINTAFEARVSKTNLIVNDREQFVRNRAV